MSNSARNIGEEERAEQTIELARSVPDAKGLEEIKDPFLKASVADALDIGRNPEDMRNLANVLAHKYPKAAEKVRKQAEWLATLEAPKKSVALSPNVGLDGTPLPKGWTTFIPQKKG